MSRGLRSHPSPNAALACLLALVLLLAGCRQAVSDASAPAAASLPAPAENEPPPLILLSLDGWRWDYHTLVATPNLQRLMARGVRAERLIPVFPSKTFPNHYTIVTGLYPAHHGIVANSMFDPEAGLRFSLGDRASVGDGRWWSGEPIWATAQRQGLRSATLFWPGSEAPINGVRPTDWTLYDGKVPNDERVDRMLAWLDRPRAEQPSLIVGYFSDTDDAGHDHGPSSAQLRDAVARVDAVLGRLLDGLATRGLTDRVNLVITSDHGMAETSADRVIIIDDHIDASSVELLDTNPTIGVWPRKIGIDEAYRRLAGAHPHLRVYRRDETPERWRYRDHRRIPPIVGVADEGWFVRRRTAKPWNGPAAGMHGYDPDALSMHGLFVAAGPAFRRGVVVAPFESVHVYNALAAALRVRPAPNDGDAAVARQLLTAAAPGTALAPTR